MTDFSTLLQQGNAWLFVPSAILLGALHGLEPGHSKTMMAAFIIAVRGTLGQAVLLGLAATLSHTAVVWAIALAGMYLGSQWNIETIEPYLQLISAAMIIAVAIWMVWRTWNQQHSCFHDHSYDHEQHAHHGHAHDHDHNHSHADKNHTHQPAHKESHQQETDFSKLALGTQDPHELAHAQDIQKRFANKHVTTGQIVMFGLTGGLIPCPASITVLLLCLQLKKITLGATLVMCFSIGLAITMVASGAFAALSLKHVSKRWNGFGSFAENAPYFSGALIILVGLYVGYQGLHGLQLV